MGRGVLETLKQQQTAIAQLSNGCLLLLNTLTSSMCHRLLLLICSVYVHVVLERVPELTKVRPKPNKTTALDRGPKTLQFATAKFAKDKQAPCSLNRMPAPKESQRAGLSKKHITFLFMISATSAHRASSDSDQPGGNPSREGNGCSSRLMSHISSPIKFVLFLHEFFPMFPARKLALLALLFIPPWL